MSQQARQYLVSKLFFQDDTQKPDLLNENMTQTDLIALLVELVNKGHHLEITAVRTDHSNDSGLGEHCHANGYCADMWPLTGPTAGRLPRRGRPLLPKVPTGRGRFAVALSDRTRRFGLHARPTSRRRVRPSFRTTEPTTCT